MREREICPRGREREIDKNAEGSEENHQEEGIDVEVVAFHTQTTRFLSDRTSIAAGNGTRPRHDIQIVDLTTTCEKEELVADEDVSYNERHSFLAVSPLAVSPPPPELPRTHLMRVASLLN